MARQGIIISLFVIVLIASCAAEILADEPTYNVLDFGAIGDGNTNDTQAFVNAWSAICLHSTRPSTLLIPAWKTFLLDRIVFQGPCNNAIHVKVDGNLKRTNEIWKENVNSWLLFIRITGLSIYGSGKLDGQGTNWWSCKEQNQCPFAAAHILELLSCTYVQIWGLKLFDSPMMHIAVGQSEDVDIGGITISSPGDSPNTDGIHIQQSRRIKIRDSVIGTGDDCVSMSDGAEDVSVSNVNCGPGHGISIGSLGMAGTMATATDIYVYNCTMSQTTNGVRIKTWQGGSGFARNISFVNITMNEVHYPIIIDQYYCPHSSCGSQGKGKSIVDDANALQATAVEVSDVKYIDVTGSSTSNVAIALNCSQSVPCTGIAMDNVNLWSANQGQRVQSYCIDAHGSAKNQVTPAVPCLTH
ncbi:putative polygalacturonase At3g15720 [Curcuma longa]|uniref:putative polygalacturonase At3g15720 n=1 Tax=Curcuma longa TaxID=136217 RepID=UPI003D9EF621